LEPCRSTGGADGVQIIVRTCIVAESQNATGMIRQWSTRVKSLQVNGVEQDLDLSLGNSLLEEQSVSTGVIHGNVAQNARKAGRKRLERNLSIT